MGISEQSGKEKIWISGGRNDKGLEELHSVYSLRSTVCWVLKSKMRSAGHGRNKIYKFFVVKPHWKRYLGRCRHM